MADSQPGVTQPSQPTPDYPGPNAPWNPFADVANAGKVVSEAQAVGGFFSGASSALKRLLDPSFWKGLGLLLGATVVGVVGLWLWLRGDSSGSDVQNAASLPMRSAARGGSGGASRTEGAAEEAAVAE